MRNFFLLLVLCPFLVTGQSAWINELHYDNEGVDTLEFIEVVIDTAVYSGSETMLYLYDGVTGLPYDSVNAAGLNQGQSAGSFVLYTWFPSAMQNGPDGIALIINAVPVQFQSYEGVFVAGGGPVSGQVSQLLPLDESAENQGTAIGLTGAGSRYPHFWWSRESASPGYINTGQVLTMEPVGLLFATDTINFGTVPYGNVSLPEVLVVAGANLTGNMSMEVPDGFEASFSADFSLSLPVGNYTIPLTDDYLPPDTLHVRFRPGMTPGQSYRGVLRFSASGWSDSVVLKGREGPYYTPNVWINELHYDNVSTDQQEFIELVIAEKDLAALDYLSLHLYNGNDQLEYRTSLAEDWITGYYDPAGFVYVTAMIPGIQNGAQDGIALAHRTRLVQFLSYEGVLTALDGPAAGTTSTDIGVMEETDSPVNSSLQLVGTGGYYNDFYWAYYAGGQTMNLPNRDQVLPVELTDYRLVQDLYGTWLTWTTHSENNNAGFQVQFSADGNHFETLAAVPPEGLVPHTYRHLISLKQPGYIRLLQTDWDSETYYYPPLRVDPDTEERNHYSILTLHGRLILENMYISPEDLKEIAGSLPSGIYIIRQENSEGIQAVKLIRQ